MDTYGDLFDGLKNKGHFPDDNDYTLQVIVLIKTKIFKKNVLSCAEHEWLKDFSKNKYVKAVRKLWIITKQAKIRL